MNRKSIILLFLIFLGFVCMNAQEAQKSDLRQRAEAEDAKGNVATARYLFIRSFEDYVKNNQTRQGVECAVRAAALYHKENYYKEAFDLLRRADQSILAGKENENSKAAMHYLTTKERLQMYMKLRKSANALDQLNIMEGQANTSGDESVKNDLLYTKAIYYYTFGQNEKGNAVFKEMADKLTSVKEYDKVDEVYQTLIANGRRSNNASLVAQSYSSYIVWKDSVSALKTAEKIDSLKQHIADNEASIDEKDSALSSRWMIIIALGVLAAALAAALAVGAVILLRFILLTRKQKKAIKLANENNALKAKFISNISAQLDPTLKKLDGRLPEVRALTDFSSHIQTLSALENSTEALELEDTPMLQFCENLAAEVRSKVKRDVAVKVNAPQMSAKINREYVSHILRHLLANAAEYTPEGGHISIDFKKRGPHSHQFLVSDTGCGIPEERREDVFKPFLEIKDLTKGDGLGLPICKQMALKMNGDLDIDPNYTKGTRFVLDLHV